MRYAVSIAVLAAVAAGILATAPTFPAAARAASPEEPLFAFAPHSPSPPIPPPTGYLNGPCGLAVDSHGDIYIADHYHDVVDVGFSGRPQLADADPLGAPCGLALDGAGDVYVNDYHRGVARYAPSSFPPESTTTYGSPTAIDSGPATGVAVDAAGHVYVDDRTHVSEYDSGGSPLGQIGAGSLEDGYGVAVSGYSSTAGFLYVADAASDTVKVYNPADSANFPADPSATIAGPPGGFTSLRDAALAVDDVSGEIYVVDDTQPTGAEQPRARVDVFGPAGEYEGHLKYDVIDGAPTGLAVDNSSGTQGRVYVTSGATHYGGIYGYGPGAATNAAPLAPAIPPAPLGGESLFPTVPIGAAAPPPSGIACEGDACQTLPAEPTDPTLTTLLEGLGNPKAHYKRYRRRKHTYRKRHSSHRRARASRVSGEPGRLAASMASTASAGGSTAAPGSGPSAATAALLSGAAGFNAALWSDGAAARQAGSHPYSLELSLGLDQSSGEADLRDLAVELPPGLLVDPAFSFVRCSAEEFAEPRSSPYETSRSGESCPDRSQVGTVEVQSGGGETRSFGLFELEPAPGSALRLGAAPFGQPLLFDTGIASGEGGARVTLRASEVPQALRAGALKLDLWGTPWDASHNAERGDCLNEAEPGFAWCKSSVGEPLNSPPRALLTLPTSCEGPLGFAASADSWQGAAASAAAQSPALEDCSSLAFEPGTEGYLSVKKASSASGFAFRLSEADPGLADPRLRVHSQARGAVVELPKGVTLNPSIGAGLETCSPAGLAAESAFNPPGAGCPNGSKIGDFSVRSPFYEGLLGGGVYLAEPYHNPYGTLLAVYLIAKSADRDLLIEVPGKLVPDPADGTLTATFDDLPQLPYTDLEVDFRTGQRAPLISPDFCGPATTKMTLTPWAQGAPSKAASSESPITSGIDMGPCPTGALPPFSPGVYAGGVNSNVGSYTPYYVHLTRKDTEQEITSYSLTLPKGITGKLAGVPQCPDPAIAAARANSGFAEAAHPSCPAASAIGRTLTGYGVGPALTYAEGKIYLAGPYHGAPLSLVTINPATVGPFDLGTIVIRSAFQIDPYTAQLRIDSRASDPIPHIIDGIPLHLRDIRIYIDRHEFTHNPTSCEPSRLESTLTGAGARLGDPSDDSTATATEHFQLLNCLTLGFHPKLGLRLRGNPHRGGFPALRVSFVSRGAEDSDLKRIEVDMPHQLFLAQNHIRAVCTRPAFEAGACPADSAYGKAVAYTPLLDQPLRGEVYLRSSSQKLPDLVTELRSGSIRIVLEGRIGPTKKGGIQAFFDNLPDAPIERFTMLLRGGNRGLLTNSVNVCKRPPAAAVKALGQNDRGAIFTSALRGQCGKGKQGKKHGEEGKGDGHRRGGGR